MTHPPARLQRVALTTNCLGGYLLLGAKMSNRGTQTLSILWEGHRSPWCDRGRYYNCQLYWEPQERSDSTHREAVGLGAHAAWRTPLLAALAATRSPGRPSAAA